MTRRSGIPSRIGTPQLGFVFSGGDDDAFEQFVQVAGALDRSEVGAEEIGIQDDLIVVDEKDPVMRFSGRQGTFTGESRGERWDWTARSKATNSRSDGYLWKGPGGSVR